VNVVCDGVVTRSVRDTAHFFAGAEQYWQNRKLPQVGLVEGPGKKRLKIGLVMDSLTGQTCPETRATVEQTVALLESLGHLVEVMPLPVKPSFVDDFSDYWGFLAFMASRFGQHSFGKGFDAEQLDGLSKGLAERFRKRGWRLPVVLMRLQRTWQQYEKVMRSYDAVLSPVLAHVTPELGYISPEVPFDELFERMMNYVSFTPMNNASGSPAISLPMGQSEKGLPIAVQFSSAHGAERTLLELAFEIEQARPWRRITAV
jgi:amidase